MIDIDKIISDFTEVVKAVGVDKDGEFRKVPEFHPTYKKCIELADHIKIHSRGEHFPDLLFKKEIPNESEDMREYREAIYRPYTRSVWKRGIINYDRVFNPQNFSITDWGNNEGVYKDDIAEDYFLKDYPVNDSIIAYYNQIVKNVKNEDPNGVISLWIDDLEESGDTELLEPYGKLWECWQRVYYEKDYEVLLSSKRSEVKFNGVAKNIGFILYVYDSEKIYKIEQYGDFIKYNFEWIEYYEHNLGYVPVKVLGGIPEKDGDYIVYHSHAEDAVSSLDDIAIDKSTLQASKIAHAYLEKWEALEDCPDPNCTNGYVGAGDDLRKCSICEGTGKFNTDVLKRYVVSVREGSDNNKVVPPAGFIDRDPEILRFLDEQIQNAERASFSYLGIDVSNTKADGQSETAMGKMIDREALFSGLMQFSDEVFDLMKFEIGFVGEVRYNDFKQPEVRKPINFALRGEKDLTLEYKEATDLPDEYKSGIYKQLNGTRFSADETRKRVDKIAQYVDSLYLRDSLQVNSMIATRQIPIWKAILHFSFDTYIVRKIDEDKNYLDKENEEIRTDFEEMAKEEAAELKIGTTEQILNAAT